MKRALQKGLLGLMVVGNLAFLGAENGNGREKGIIKTEVVSNTVPVSIAVPVYSDREVPADNCGKYVRLAAKELFGFEYQQPANAWDMRYQDKIVAYVGVHSLEQLAYRGILKPGMVVGVRNQKSPYNFGRDKEGKQREYTHVLLFLGTNTFGEPVFAHKYGAKTEVITPHKLNNLIPKEILAPREK